MANQPMATSPERSPIPAPFSLTTLNTAQKLLYSGTALHIYYRRTMHVCFRAHTLTWMAYSFSMVHVNVLESPNMVLGHCQ